MKFKRITLIVVLIALFAVCFESMNSRYDPLARYSYNSQLTAQEKELMISHMSNEDIDYVIQAKLKPEQFLKYIELENFKVKNTLYYEKCETLQNNDINEIIKFVNTYRSKLKYSNLDTILLAYSYTTLAEFYSGAYSYDPDAKLVVNPLDINASIKENETLYKYVPKDLVEISNQQIPIASLIYKETLQVKSEVLQPLLDMCNALAQTNNLTCGGLILTSAYESYSDQIKIYEQNLVKYGADEILKYEDYPGKSESQLGYTVKFTIAGLSDEEIKESEQVKWLAEHASEYGFIIRYPKEKESHNNKYYQPLTLRYVGINEVEEASLEEDNTIQP